MHPDGNGRSPVDRRSVARREFIAAGAAAATVGFGGCAAAYDLVYADEMADVLVTNWTTEVLAGRLALRDPAQELVLEERFELVPDDRRADDDDPDGEYVIQYDGVLAASGEYEVAVELEEADVDGVEEVVETVSVSDPDEDHVGVFLGADRDGPIAVTIVETPSDVLEYDDSVSLPG